MNGHFGHGVWGMELGQLWGWYFWGGTFLKLPDIHSWSGHFSSVGVGLGAGTWGQHMTLPRGESFLVSRTRAVVGKQRGYLALLFASCDDQRTRVSGLGLLYGYSFLHIPVAWRILLLGVYLF